MYIIVHMTNSGGLIYPFHFSPQCKTSRKVYGVQAKNKEAIKALNRASLIEKVQQQVQDRGGICIDAEKHVQR